MSAGYILRLVFHPVILVNVRIIFFIITTIRLEPNNAIIKEKKWFQPSKRPAAKT